MCKGPGGEVPDTERACCCRKWVGACQGSLERPAGTCSKERHVLVRRTQKPALWVTMSWMFSCLTLESEAINGRESSAGIGQEGLNCIGGQWLGVTFTGYAAAHLGKSRPVAGCV